MKNKSIMTLIITGCIFSTLFVMGLAQETNPQNHGLIGTALYYEVTAPSDIQTEKILSVKFSFKAEKDLQVESITVNVQGAGIDYAKTLVVDASIDAGTWISETIPFTPTSEGVVYCRVLADYMWNRAGRWTYGYADVTFDVTQVRNSTYEDLLETIDSLNEDKADMQSDYDALESTHHSLQDAYDTLQDDYQALTQDMSELQSRLETNTTVMYAFIVATIVFIITTAYFARHRLWSSLS
jgi:hypothetical protein